MNVSEATAFSTMCDWISGELDEAPEKEISYLATRSAKTLMVTPKLPVDMSELQIVSVNAIQDEDHRVVAEEYLKHIDVISVLEISDRLGLDFSESDAECMVMEFESVNLRSYR